MLYMLCFTGTGFEIMSKKFGPLDVERAQYHADLLNFRAIAVGNPFRFYITPILDI